MARWKGTLIGGGIGWAFGGPIGGILGAIVGNFVEAAGSKVARDYDGRSGGSFHTAHEARSSTPGDFAVSLLVLFAHIVKADNKILSEEIKYVKEYLIRQFGTKNAKDMMLIFKDLLDKDYNIQAVCRQIDSHLTYHSKLEMLHILFGIAISDHHLHELEIRAIHEIAQALRISESDYKSIKAIFVKDEDQAYRILGLNESASDDEVKSAYRELAKKYHPDKIHDLGDDFKKVAEEKFKAVSNAYQEIKSRRGF